MNESAISLGGIAAWLAVWVVLYVASDLNPTLRSWLLVIVAIPAVSQFTLLILDTSLVKGWRADRRVKKRLRQAWRPRTGASEKRRSTRPLDVTSGRPEQGSDGQCGGCEADLNGRQSD